MSQSHKRARTGSRSHKDPGASAPVPVSAHIPPHSASVSEAVGLRPSTAFGLATTSGLPQRSAALLDEDLQDALGGLPDLPEDVVIDEDDMYRPVGEHEFMQDLQERQVYYHMVKPGMTVELHPPRPTGVQFRRGRPEEPERQRCSVMDVSRHHVDPSTHGATVMFVGATERMLIPEVWWNSYEAMTVQVIARQDPDGNVLEECVVGSHKYGEAAPGDFRGYDYLVPSGQVAHRCRLCGRRFTQGKVWVNKLTGWSKGENCCQWPEDKRRTERSQSRASGTPHAARTSSYYPESRGLSGRRSGSRGTEQAEARRASAREGRVPLTHAEVWQLLDGRIHRQRKRIETMKVLGVYDGEVDSFVSWETRQAGNIIRKCWNYTGLGVGGFGQGQRGGKITRDAADGWRDLIERGSRDGRNSLLGMRLEWDAEYRVAVENRNKDAERQGGVTVTLAPEGGFLSQEEAVVLCNLIPGNAEEAKAVRPSVKRFADVELDKVCQAILTENDRCSLGGAAGAAMAK